MKLIMIRVIFGFYFFGTQAAYAEAMKCSGEQKNCISACTKSVNPALVSNCIANCRVRLNTCKQTGCWDNGTNRYCNLTRQ